MQPIIESFITKGRVIEAAKESLPPKTLCRAKYKICGIGKKNRNNRVYEKAVWERVLGDAEIKEKLANKSLFFHAEHPTTTQSSGEKIAGVVTGISIDEAKGEVFATMDVLETPYGQIVDTLLQAGCGIGVSTRADGELEEAIDEGGQKYHRVVPESYRFVTVDFTADPSSFGSEMPMNVQRNVAGAIKAGLDNEKIDRAYATVLLEHLKCNEAVSILESIKIDEKHPGCKCKATEKHCGKGCPHSKLKEADSKFTTSSDNSGQPANGKAAAEVMKKSAKKSDVKITEEKPNEEVLLEPTLPKDEAKTKTETPVEETFKAGMSVKVDERNGVIAHVFPRTQMCIVQFADIKETLAFTKITPSKVVKVAETKTPEVKLAGMRCGCGALLESVAGSTGKYGYECKACMATRLNSKWRNVVESVKCPACGSKMIGYKDSTICPKCVGAPTAMPNADVAIQPETPLPVAEKKVNEYIKKVGDEWQVTSHKGKNLGRYKSKAEAHKRLGQVEYFKKNESKVNEVEFTNLDSILSSDQPMSLDDLVAAVKLSMSAEFDATELYKKIAQATDNEMAKRVMKSIADEESVHAGEFRKLLTTLDSSELELEDRGEKEASDLIDQTSPSESVIKESLLKPGHKVKYQGKEYTVTAVNNEEMLITIDSGFGGTITVAADEIEDFMNEVKEGYNDIACNDCGYVGHLNSFSRGFKDKTTCPVCKSIQIGFDADRKKPNPMKTEEAAMIIPESKMKEFLQDNLDQSISEQDVVENAARLFKVPAYVVKDYASVIMESKKAAKAVETELKEAQLLKVDKLQETVNNLNAVIEAYQESQEQSVKDATYYKNEIATLKESIGLNKEQLSKQTLIANEQAKQIQSMTEAKQSLVEEQEKQITILKEQHNHALIKSYVSARTKALRLTLAPKALTILESYESESEVEAGIRQIQDNIREGILQSNIPSIVEVKESHPVDPKLRDISNKVAKAFRSFGA